MNRIIGDKEIMPRLQRACLGDLNFANGGLDASDLAEIAGVFGLSTSGTRTNLRYTICSALYPEQLYREEDAPPAPVVPVEADGFQVVATKARVRKTAPGGKAANRGAATRIQGLAYSLFNEISAVIDSNKDKSGSSGYFMAFTYKVPGRGNRVETTHYAEPGADLTRDGVPYVVLLHGPLGRERDGRVIVQKDILRVFDMLNEHYMPEGLVIADFFNLGSRRNELWVIQDKAKWLAKESKMRALNTDVQETRYYIKPTEARARFS